ncbi:hypothetical protein MFLAVUS_002861 [Mucor flavus]|uniref:Mitochondrial protein n=1 Tax=Mucor flavus TaxID=439312 RepID=A0ABP9YRG7_9FUNG
MQRSIRLRPIRQLFLQRRTVFNDSSRPFPPPQPTRPIDHLDDINSNNNKHVFSPALDAVVDDPTLQANKDPFAFRQSHHFDTYQVLIDLQSQGFTRKQAEVIMKGIKFRLRECTASVRQQLLQKSDLENESYLFRAALSELRTEVQVMRRNDMQMLQTEMSLITREVDSLEQRLSEGVADMKNEIQMDMNNRKNETRQDQKKMDMQIQEINNKFTIRLGDIRTEIEAVRWETIWKGMAGVALAGLTIASLGYLLTRYSVRKATLARLEDDKKRKLKQEEASRAGTADMEVIY